MSTKFSGKKLNVFFWRNISDTYVSDLNLTHMARFKTGATPVKPANSGKGDFSKRSVISS